MDTGGCGAGSHASCWGERAGHRILPASGASGAADNHGDRGRCREPMRRLRCYNRPRAASALHREALRERQERGPERLCRRRAHGVRPERVFVGHTFASSHSFISANARRASAPRDEMGHPSLRCWRSPGQRRSAQAACSIHTSNDVGPTPGRQCLTKTSGRRAALVPPSGPYCYARGEVNGRRGRSRGCSNPPAPR